MKSLRKIYLLAVLLSFFTAISSKGFAFVEEGSSGTKDCSVASKKACITIKLPEGDVVTHFGKAKQSQN